MDFDKLNDKINKLKTMSMSELYELSDSVRAEILSTVSKNGGHLASNLGMVEPTIVLHKLFDSPNDTIIFDVGHQCYTHKILTGRADRFDSIRKFGGLSGFTSRKESEHDILYEGHSGTSISAALGVAEANRLLGNDNYTVAVVGDGALTNGMIYEALNNCADKNLRLIVLINDNEMSISKNVGGLHNYLTKIRISKKYFSLKRGLEGILAHIPLIGHGFVKFLKITKDFFKRWVVSQTLFEDMGLIYLGPVDGNNIEKLTVVLEEAKTKTSPCVVHMKTQKGYGYSFAKEHPEYYHGVAPFDLSAGVKPEKSMSFSTYFGDELCKRAEKDDKICAITAAMRDGTGLTEFSERFPKNFFDVGIAEEHAITFAGGLAANKMKPVVVLYSTFAQRVFDQLFHDVAIQELSLVLALDRSGLVPDDGITHQGIFDYSIFSSIPNVYIYSPSRYSEVSEALDEALDSNRISIIRYPKGVEKPIPIENNSDFIFTDKHLYYTNNTVDADIVIISYGRMMEQAYEAYSSLQKKCNVGLIGLKLIFPLEPLHIEKLCKNAKLVYIIDEGIKSGGVGEKLTSLLYQSGFKGIVKYKAIEGFVEHGDLSSLMKKLGFKAEQIIAELDALAEGLRQSPNTN